MYNMKGYKFKNEEEDKRQKFHGNSISIIGRRTRKREEAEFEG